QGAQSLRNVCKQVPIRQAVERLGTDRPLGSGSREGVQVSEFRLDGSLHRSWPRLPVVVRGRLKLACPPVRLPHRSRQVICVETVVFGELDERRMGAFEKQRTSVVVIARRSGRLRQPRNQFSNTQHHTSSTPSSPVSPWLLCGARPLLAGRDRLGFRSRPTTSELRQLRPFRPSLSHSSEGAAS